MNVYEGILIIDISTALKIQRILQRQKCPTSLNSSMENKPSVCQLYMTNLSSNLKLLHGHVNLEVWHEISTWMLANIEIKVGQLLMFTDSCQLFDLFYDSEKIF